MYVPMADVIKPCEVGSAKVDIFEIKKESIPIRALLMGIPEGRYARLMVNGRTIMSDTPMEKRTNSSFIYNAHGDVLIGGLGIGMVILAIQDKEKVRSVTVLENNPDVIAAVQHQLPLNEKVKIIQGDVYTWKPDVKYDCIYMDIWGDISTDSYEEMKMLKRKYGHYLKPIKESPERFNWCWAEYYAKTGRPLI